MGAIKDLVDLVTQLTSSIDDRKFAGELREIQSMISSIQSEHAELHEDRIRLMTRNAELVEEAANLKNQLADLRLEQANSNSSSDQGSQRLAEEGETILKLIAENEDIMVHQLASMSGIEQLKCQYWLDQLSERDFIYFPLIMDDNPERYSITADGRAYMVNHGLIT